MELFDKSEFINVILNGLSVGIFLAYLCLFCIGSVIHFTMDVRDSVRNDNKTPNKFKFWFMVKDNLFRFVGVLAMIYINVVFFEDIWGVQPTAFLMVTLGYSIDSIIGRGAKGAKRSIQPMKDSRDKLLANYKK